MAQLRNWLLREKYADILNYISLITHTLKEQEHIQENIKARLQEIESDDQ